MLGLGREVAGISIEATGIRYISFKNTKTWEVRKQCFLPLVTGVIVENQVVDSQALYEVVKQWVKAEGLRGKRVALSIPPSQIIIRAMSIPSTDSKQVAQLVKLEVETGLHLPFDNPVYDYVTTDVDDEQSHLLVFAAPRKSIEDYVGVLESAGLRMSSVEISATALARSMAAAHAESFTETMLINLEHSLMDISMFRDGNPVFIRTINLYDLNQEQKVSGIGMDSHEDSHEDSQYLAEIAATAEEYLSPEQMLEITAEISRMLNFYQYSLHDGSTRINNILITGEASLRKQLQDELQLSMAEVEITPISLDYVTDVIQPDAQLNDYRVAAGAALKIDVNSTIDLLPREDREALLFPYIAIALIGIWLLGALGTGVYFAANKGRISNGEEQLQGLSDRSIMLQVELGKRTNSGAGQLDRKSAIEAIQKNKQDAVAILDLLKEGLPAGAVIRDINYMNGVSIDLTVNVPTMEDASSYLKKLRQMAFSVDVSILKLAEEFAADNTDSPAAMLSTKMYTASYKVNLAAVKQPENAVAASQEEVDSNGTDQ